MSPSTRFFIGCDWGTSSLRLAWVDRDSRKIIHKIHSSLGIKKVYEAWQREKEGVKTTREAYFSQALIPFLQELGQKVGHGFEGSPVIISGMASSSIGLKELPYSSLPYSLHRFEGVIHTVPAGKLLAHPIMLVSGVEKPGDVMRGEETQALGLHSVIKATSYLVILPGTHSKHLEVKNGKMHDFSTFMTGELFDIIQGYSILGNSVSAVSLKENDPREGAFFAGVHSGSTQNLVQELFSIRAKHLQGSLGKEEGFLYLSGMLIGQELKSLDKGDDSPIYVVSSSMLKNLYELALIKLGFENRLTPIPRVSVEDLSFLGQAKLIEED